MVRFNTYLGKLRNGSSLAFDFRDGGCGYSIKDTNIIGRYPAGLMRGEREKWRRGGELFEVAASPSFKDPLSLGNRVVDAAFVDFYINFLLKRQIFAFLGLKMELHQQKLTFFFLGVDVVFLILFLRMFDHGLVPL